MQKGDARGLRCTHRYATAAVCQSSSRPKINGFPYLVPIGLTPSIRFASVFEERTRGRAYRARASLVPATEDDSGHGQGPERLLRSKQVPCKGSGGRRRRRRRWWWWWWSVHKSGETARLAGGRCRRRKFRQMFCGTAQFAIARRTIGIMNAHSSRY